MDPKTQLYLLRITPLVGMVLDGGFTIRLLQIILRCALRDPQNSIVLGVVALLRRSPKHLQQSINLHKTQNRTIKPHNKNQDPYISIHVD